LLLLLLCRSLLWLFVVVVAVNEMCALEDGCYHIAVGAGRDSRRGTFELCGETHAAPAFGQMCKNSTINAEGTAIVKTQCWLKGFTPGEHP
jgi:hypothetical protein